MPRLLPHAAIALTGAAMLFAIGGTVAARPLETGPSADALVAARQAGFRLNFVSFAAMKAAIARGDDVKTLALPAGAIGSWARAMPALFPAGSATPQSKALPTIWSDRAGFDAAAADMAAAAAKLAEAAKAGDAAAFSAQYAVLGSTCGACHKKYRAEDKR